MEEPFLLAAKFVPRKYLQPAKFYYLLCLFGAHLFGWVTESLLQLLLVHYLETLDTEPSEMLHVS